MLTRLLEKFFPESSFTNFWKDDQKRAFVLLPIWILFIIWVIFAFVVPYQRSLENKKNNTTPVEEVPKEITLNDMWLELFKHNFEFEYVYTDSLGTITYKGTQLEDKISLYKYVGNTFEQYYIDGDYIYTVNAGEINFSVIYDFLTYEDYLSIDNIYALIHDINPNVEENQYHFEKEGKYVTIKVLENNIESISLTSEDKTYTLKFWNINQIDSISY